MYSGFSATQYWRGKVLEVAKDFPEYVFAVSDEEDYSSEIKDLGLLESGEDVNVAILDEGGKKYAMEPEEFDSDVLRQFVVAFKKGTRVSKIRLSKLLALFSKGFSWGYGYKKVKCATLQHSDLKLLDVSYLFLLFFLSQFTDFVF